MTSLTVGMREDIVRRAQKHAFDKRTEELAAAEDKLFSEVHAVLFKKGWLDIAAKLPERWMPRTRFMRINAHGEQIELRLLPDSPEVIVPYRNSSGSTIGSYHHTDGSVADTGEPDCLSRRLSQHARAKDKLKEERKAAGEALKKMLKEFRTVKQMLAAWPEGEPFYKHLDGVKRVPMLPIQKINDLFDLPVEEAAK